MSEMQREVMGDNDAVARRAAALLIEALATTTGPVAVSLAGGSTPRRLYETLAMPDWRRRLPWERVHWFWSEERFVPPEHADSNFRMARTAMLAPVGVNTALIHPVPTVDLEPATAAARYQSELQQFYGATALQPERALFAVSVLGVGDDGHTAALFPDTPVLQEQQRWVAAVIGARPEPRITLTYPALNSAELTLVLAVGTGKRAIMDRIKVGADVPLARLRPQGRWISLLDRTASGIG
jgi:6-phosphogluconolactonase